MIDRFRFGLMGCSGPVPPGSPGPVALSPRTACMGVAHQPQPYLWRDWNPQHTHGDVFGLIDLLVFC